MSLDEKSLNKMVQISSNYPSLLEKATTTTIYSNNITTKEISLSRPQTVQQQKKEKEEKSKR